MYNVDKLYNDNTINIISEEKNRENELLDSLKYIHKLEALDVLEEDYKDNEIIINAIKKQSDIIKDEMLIADYIKGVYNNIAPKELEEKYSNNDMISKTTKEQLEANEHIILSKLDDYTEKNYNPKNLKGNVNFFNMLEIFEKMPNLSEKEKKAMIFYSKALKDFNEVVKSCRKNMSFIGKISKNKVKNILFVDLFFNSAWAKINEKGFSVESEKLYEELKLSKIFKRNSLSKEEHEKIGNFRLAAFEILRLLLLRKQEETLLEFLPKHLLEKIKYFKKVEEENKDYVLFDPRLCKELLVKKQMIIKN